MACSASDLSNSDAIKLGYVLPPPDTAPKSCGTSTDEDLATHEFLAAAMQFGQNFSAQCRVRTATRDLPDANVLAHKRSHKSWHDDCISNLVTKPKPTTVSATPDKELACGGNCCSMCCTTGNASNRTSPWKLDDQWKCGVLLIDIVNDTRSKFAAGCRAPDKERSVRTDGSAVGIRTRDLSNAYVLETNESQVRDFVVYHEKRNSRLTRNASTRCGWLTSKHRAPRSFCW